MLGQSLPPLSYLLAHLQRIGEEMQRLLTELEAAYGDQPTYHVLAQVFKADRTSIVFFCQGAPATPLGFPVAPTSGVRLVKSEFLQRTQI